MSAERRRPPLGRLVVGAGLVVAGLGWLLNSLGIVDVPLRALWPIALIVIGAGLIAGARTGPHTGLIFLGVLLTVALAVGSVAAPVGDDDGFGFGVGVGERVVRPVLAADLLDRYELDAGHLILDLTSLEPRRGTQEVDVRVSMGRITVRVPGDLALRVRARAGIGQVTLFGDEDGGFGVEDRFTSRPWERGVRRLELDLRVGVGQATVEEAASRVPRTPEPVEPFPFEPRIGDRGGRA
jgi:hypothetical protein